VFAFLGKYKTFDLKIYYDSDCTFCGKTVNYIKTFFLLPKTRVIPAPEDPKILALMQKENSFVVEDAGGKKYFRSEAIFAIAKASPLVFLLHRIGDLPGIHRLVDRVYNFIALRRHAVCPVRLKGKTVVKPLVDFSLPFNIIGCFFLVYILLWNVQHFFPDTRLPTELGYTLGIWQKWTMFSPNPPKISGWYVVVGKLADGTEVDMLNPGGSVSWDEPKGYLSLKYDYKEKNVLTKLDLGNSRNKFKFLYADYLCRNWNESHPGQKLSSVEVFLMAKRVPPPGRAYPEPEKNSIINYRCNTGINPDF
jgi:predicted DCC family thiol-disulfide oxidoreductase YuxK